MIESAKLFKKVQELEAEASAVPWSASEGGGYIRSLGEQPAGSRVGVMQRLPEVNAAYTVLTRNTYLGLLRAATIAEEEEYQPGNPRKCTQQAPGFERDECGKCRFCLRRTALAAVARAVEE